MWSGFMSFVCKLVVCHRKDAIFIWYKKTICRNVKNPTMRPFFRKSWKLNLSSDGKTYREIWSSIFWIKKQQRSKRPYLYLSESSNETPELVVCSRKGEDLDRFPLVNPYCLIGRYLNILFHFLEIKLSYHSKDIHVRCLLVCQVTI